MVDVPPKSVADRVLADGDAARREAVERLGPEHSVADQVDALWTIGRIALEDNRLEEAGSSLERAVRVAQFEPEMQSRVRGTLAVVQMKLGLADQAFRTLALAEEHADDEDLGRLINQRGMMLVDQGRLSEAHDVLLRSLGALRDTSDRSAEARTLCNLGAVASMMWSLDEAIDWFSSAHELSLATGQRIVTAGIEGNRGYLHGLLGETQLALEWYERARLSFADLDGVEMSVATLECDAARTLLDAGLIREAVEAARRSSLQAESGQNPMLAAQAKLLLAEALLESGRVSEAVNLLEGPRTVFVAAAADAAVLQVDCLLLRAIADRRNSTTPPLDPSDVRALSQRLEEAGWLREAISITAHAAVEALEADDPKGALSCAERFVSRVSELGRVNSVDTALIEAVHRTASGDRRGAFAALGRGLRAVENMASLAGSSELRAGFTRSQRSLSVLAMRLVLERPKAASVLRWADRLERVRLETVAPSTATASERDAAERLRSTFVQRESLRRSGHGVIEIDQAIRRLEQELRSVALRRPATARSRGARGMVDVTELRRALDGRVVVQFVEAGNRLLAVVVEERRSRLIELASLSEVSPIVETQRRAMARLGRPATPGRLLAAAEVDFHRSSNLLNRTLVEPLRLAGESEVVLVASRHLRSLGWGALSSLADHPVTVATSASSWLSGHRAPRDLSSVGLVVGPDVGDVESEVAAMVDERRARTVEVAKTVSGAASLLERHSLVHIAAHGEFRSDSPRFSAVRLDDGPLTVGDIEQLSAAPELVVLGSCEAASSSHASGEAFAGTTAALLGCGAGVVVAPTTTVGASSVSRLLGAFHREFARGESAAVALQVAQREARETGTPQDAAVAAAFAVHGSRCIPNE